MTAQEFPEQRIYRGYNIRLIDIHHQTLAKPPAKNRGLSLQYTNIDGHLVRRKKFDMVLFRTLKIP